MHVPTAICLFLQKNAFSCRKMHFFCRKNAVLGGRGHIAGNRRKSQEGFRAQESRARLANFHKINGPQCSKIRLFFTQISRRNSFPWRGPSWNCPRAVLLPLQNSALFEGKKRQNGAEKRGRKGLASKGGKKGKRTRETKRECSDNPDPNTSAQASRDKWEPYRHKMGGVDITAHQEERIPLTPKLLQNESPGLMLGRDCLRTLLENNLHNP